MLLPPKYISYRRGNGINISLRLVVGFLLFVLQIDLDPANYSANGSIQTLIKLGLNLLHQNTLLKYIVRVFGRITKKEYP